MALSRVISEIFTTDKEREEMEEVCSIGEVPHKRAVSDFETQLSLWVKESDQ